MQSRDVGRRTTSRSSVFTTAGLGSARRGDRRRNHPASTGCGDYPDGPSRPLPGLLRLPARPRRPGVPSTSQRASSRGRSSVRRCRCGGPSPPPDRQRSRPPRRSRPWRRKVPAGAGPLRTGGSQAGNGHDANARMKQHLRPCRRPAAHPPTGASSCKCTFDRDVSNRRIDELPTIDIHCLGPLPDARSRQSPEAASLVRTIGETPERLCANARKRPLRRGKSSGPGATLGTGKTACSPHEPLIGSNIVAEVPLAGLFLFEFGTVVLSPATLPAVASTPPTDPREFDAMVRSRWAALTPSLPISGLAEDRSGRVVRRPVGRRGLRDPASQPPRKTRPAASMASTAGAGRFSKRSANDMTCPHEWNQPPSVG